MSKKLSLNLKEGNVSQVFTTQKIKRSEFLLLLITRESLGLSDSLEFRNKNNTTVYSFLPNCWG